MICKNNKKRIAVICVCAFFLIVSLIHTNVYAADNEFYACPKQKVDVAVPYRPDVSGDIKYTFSGCNCMTVSGSYPNYSIAIRDEGSYHITATSNSPFLLNYDYYFYINHEWNDDYTVDRSPTCTESGVQSIHCGRCGATKEEASIPASGHTWEEEPTTDLEPTCTEEGSQSFHCKKCEAISGVESIPAKGHSWEEEPTIDLEPTCTEEGSQSFHCKKCEARKDTESINKLGHDLIHHDIGWTEYDTCSRCDYSTFSDPGEYGVWIYERELTSDYCADDTGLNSWSYDVQTNTLTINRNMSMQVRCNNMPYIYSSHDLTINCEGHDYSMVCENYSYGMGISVDGLLTITGGGTFTIKALPHDEFCGITADTLTVDGTELIMTFQGTNGIETSKTGAFAHNIYVQNGGCINYNAGKCHYFTGIATDSTGEIVVNNGEIYISHTIDGSAVEHGVDCGLFKCIDGNVYIADFREKNNTPICLRAKKMELIKGSLETSVTGTQDNTGYSLFGDRIEITSEFHLTLSDYQKNRWNTTPVFYANDINDVVINNIADQEYTGHPIEPKLTIKYNDYIMPTGEHEPCLVDYEDNVRPGTGKANIACYDYYGNLVGIIIKEFNIVGCEHENVELITGTQPTCKSMGNIEYYKCRNCGKDFYDRDCLEPIYNDEFVIPATGHSYSAWTTTITATETNAGQQSRICSRCGVTETKAIPKLTPSSPSVAPSAMAVTTPAEIMDLPTVKISKPKAAKKKITVKWKKVSKKNLKKIGGIQIQVATDPNFTNIVKTATAGKKKTSKVIKGLHPKTKYYVRVRAYRGDHRSAWSGVKSGKAK